MDQLQPNMGYGPLPSPYPPANAGGNNRMKLAIAFVALMVLIVGGVLFAILGNKEDPSKAVMLKLVSNQSEMLRLSDEYGTRLKTAPVKSRNAELRTNLLSSIDRLAEDVTRVYGVKKFNFNADEEADEKLTSAVTLNRLDETYSEVISEKLADQVETITEAQGLVKSKQTKELLAEMATDQTELQKRFAGGDD